MSISSRVSSASMSEATDEKRAYSGAELLGMNEWAGCSWIYGGGGIGVSDQVVDGMLAEYAGCVAGAAENSRMEMDGLMLGGS